MRDRLRSFTKSTLGAGGSIHQAVTLPPGESCAGMFRCWIDVSRQITLIWLTLTELEQECAMQSMRPRSMYRNAN
jgi:MOB kinase activator 1